MHLVVSENLAEHLEKIYLAQPKPRFYGWCLDINNQLEFLESKLKQFDLEFTVEDFTQDGDSLRVTVSGDPDQVSRMDMALLVYSNAKSMQYLVTLRHMDKE